MNEIAKSTYRAVFYVKDSDGVMVRSQVYNSRSELLTAYVEAYKQEHGIELEPWAAELRSDAGRARRAKHAQKA